MSGSRGVQGRSAICSQYLQQLLCKLAFGFYCASSITPPAQRTRILLAVPVVFVRFVDADRTPLPAGQFPFRNRKLLARPAVEAANPVGDTSNRYPLPSPPRPDNFHAAITRSRTRKRVVFCSASDTSARVSLAPGPIRDTGFHASQLHMIPASRDLVDDSQSIRHREHGAAADEYLCCYTDVLFGGIGARGYAADEAGRWKILTNSESIS